MTRHLDRIIASIARHQYGLISTRQAAAAGVSAEALQHRADGGRLEQVRLGVWRVAGAPAMWEQSALAAVLGGGPDCVLSFGAAARLWGFETWQRSAVEITELRGRSCALDAVRCHRSTVFEIDSTVHQGIPVTTAARTIIDLSGRLDVPALGRLTDEGLRRRLFRIEELAECASRLRSARGRRMKVVHAVLRLRIAGYDPGESGFEARVASVLTKLQGAPPVVHQHPVCIGGRNYRIDLAHPTLLLAHECDGWSFHNTRTAFSNDRARANDLAAAGWTVLRYTTDMTNAAIARYAVDTINRLRRCA